VQGRLVEDYLAYRHARTHETRLSKQPYLFLAHSGSIVQEPPELVDRMLTDELPLAMAWQQAHETARIQRHLLVLTAGLEAVEKVDVQMETPLANMSTSPSPPLPALKDTTDAPPTWRP
jgi:hypothetical protein